MTRFYMFTLRDVIESLNNIWFWVFGTLLLSGGACAGYFYARLRWRNRSKELADLEVELRRQRVELQRLSYQESTSNSHQSSLASEKSKDALEALLHQSRQDYSILEQENQFEMSLFREENHLLREELALMKGLPTEPLGISGGNHFEDAKELDFEPEELDPPVEQTRQQEEEVALVDEQADPQPEQPEQTAQQVEEVPLVEEMTSQQPEVLSQEVVNSSQQPNVQPNFEDFEFHWTEEPTISVPSKVALPVFRTVSDFVPASDAPLPTQKSTTLTNLVGLSPDQFELLSDLGFASAEKLSLMTPEEIIRLSEIFRVSPEFIQSNWITRAQPESH